MSPFSERFLQQRLKIVVDIRPSGVDKNTIDGETAVRLCNYMDVYKNDCINTELPFMEASATPAEVERFALKAGDVLITKDSETAADIAAAALVDASATGVVCGYHLALLRPRTGIVDGRYLFWTLKAPETLWQFSLRANGITRFGLTSRAIGEVLVALPPIDDQIAIARFLDEETSKVDALITEQRKLIELMKEKRQATISYAVTKGINPNATMKNSGIEWLGQVPAHWEILSLKYVASFNDEVLPESTDPERAIEYIDIGGVSMVEGIGIPENLNFANAPSRARRLVRNGDVIISTVRTYLKAIAAISNPSPQLVVSTGFAVIRPGKRIAKAYASYSLQSDYFMAEVISKSTGVSYPAINASEMASIEVCLPSMIEQEDISYFLKVETSKIDNLIAEAENTIALLQERRTALISAAVTGKIDARGLVPTSNKQDAA